MQNHSTEKNAHIAHPKEQHFAAESTGTIRQTLKETFGISSLRPGQKDVIDNVLKGKNTLAIMPTGAGKSLCYQLPGLKIKGMTVIVSPLISLMKTR